MVNYDVNRGVAKILVTLQNDATEQLSVSFASQILYRDVLVDLLAVTRAVEYRDNARAQDYLKDLLRYFPTTNLSSPMYDGLADRRSNELFEPFHETVADVVSPRANAEYPALACAQVTLRFPLAERRQTAEFYDNQGKQINLGKFIELAHGPYADEHQNRDLVNAYSTVLRDFGLEVLA